MGRYATNRPWPTLAGFSVETLANIGTAAIVGNEASVFSDKVIQPGVI